MNTKTIQQVRNISPSVSSWRIVQSLMFIVGGFILYLLFFEPSLGILLLWNFIVPIAPVLVLLFPGLWRNICPMGIVSLLPRHAKLSNRKTIKQSTTAILNLMGIIALYVIVPLRHTLFNLDGIATGTLIISLAIVGFILGLRYEWKSAWCSGICPVHPVEQLYGSHPVMTFNNMHCSICTNCTVPCPDSTPHFHPGISHKHWIFSINQVFITGGLPGFIWGWFQVPDITNSTILSVYIMPFSGLTLSIAIYLFLTNTFPLRKNLINEIFATAGITLYYWHRIPSLFGFGIFPSDGILINLSHTISSAFVLTLQILVCAFFIYWILIRDNNKSSWLQRPKLRTHHQ